MQDWGSYTNETLVIVGTDYDETIHLLHRLGARQFAGVKKEMFTAGHRGCVLHTEGATLLWFPEWKNNWEHIDVLVHEISHLIFFVMMQGKGMEDESEAMAYQQEYLFKKIRQNLYDLSTKPYTKRQMYKAVQA